VLAIGGATLRAHLAVVAARHRELIERRLPERLGLGEMKLIGATDGSYRVVGYSDYDSLELPRELVGALRHFEGRTIAEARRAILEMEGLELDDELLQMLVDFELLSPGPSKP
jgi:hypothetical protein